MAGYDKKMFLLLCSYLKRNKILMSKFKNAFYFNLGCHVSFFISSRLYTYLLVSFSLFIMYKDLEEENTTLKYDAAPFLFFTCLRGPPMFPLGGLESPRV